MFTVFKPYTFPLHQFRCFGSTSITFKGKSSSSSRWLNRQTNDLYTKRAKQENLKSRAAFKLLQIDEKFKIFRKGSHQQKLNVLDLGAAPGAWNQVSIERSPKGSKVLGVDILPYQPPAGCSSIQGNILNKATHELIKDFFTFSEIEQQKHMFEEVEIISRNGKTVEKIQEISLLEQESEINQLNAQISNSHQVETLEKHKRDYPVDIILSDMMANTTGLNFKDHVMSMDLCDAALITSIDLLKKDGHLIMKFFTGEEDKLLENKLKFCFKDVKRFKPKACRVESKECYFVCLNKKQYEFDKVSLFTMKF